MNRSLFITDQGLQILEGSNIDLNYHLHPSRFRGSAEKPVLAGPAGEGAGSAADWMPVAQTLSHLSAAASPQGSPASMTDADALLYRLDPTLARAAGIALPAALRLHRVAMIADSGFGKTVRLKWIRWELARRKSRLIPFLLNIDTLPRSSEELMAVLLDQMRVAGNEKDRWADSDAQQTLDRWRRTGRIVLLLDAADQIREIENLNRLMNTGLWRHCPIVVSGRPEVIHTHRRTFLPEIGFRFVRPMELTDDQLKTYIGPERYELLQAGDMEDAVEVLRNPRVAWYLGYVISKEELARLKSASDVFESATSHLLTEGLRGKAAFRFGVAVTMEERTKNAEPPEEFKPNHDSQVERGHRLLSAIAFEQMLLPPEDSEAGETAPEDQEDAPPNFSGVNNDELPPFLNRVFDRVKAHDPRYSDKTLGRDLFNFDMECLSAANVAITRGLLDVASLFREIRWRNKSLQEFYAARWLANYASDDDIRYLTARRYHPLQRDTFWFYWVERYLCEMPRRAGEQACWARAVEPFLLPGDGTAAGTHRSCEMIYRAWPRLRVAPKGRHERTVRDRFLGEFETEILSGKQDAKADLKSPESMKPSEAARELQQSFVDIPAGRFRMGAPDDKQGMGPEAREAWEAYIARHRRNDSFELFLEERLEPLKDRSRTDSQRIEWARQQFTQAFQQGVDFVERWQYPHDETPEPDCEELDMEAFRMSRFPVLNRWYRLFDPSHGLEGSPHEDYESISGMENRPLIYADWYMSWCFALFCHWEGQSCELPGEDQWEYAAKAEQTVVMWPEEYKDFWWGDNFEEGRHHCTSHAKQTSPPPDFTRRKAGDRHHENPFGLVDMIGNVLEWTHDRYRRRYSRTASTERTSAFVLRGGAWVDNVASNLRCGRRFSSHPTDALRLTGCRLVRVARARKS